MTLPTLFSNVAANGGVQQPRRDNGSVYGIKAVATVPLATAGGTKIGMLRIRPGDRVFSHNLHCTDIDSGSAITLDMGVTYDDSTLSGSESVDGFVDGSAIPNHATTRNVVWPASADAEAFASGFTAAGYGYVTVTILDSGSGGTTSAGTLTLTSLVSDCQA